MITGAHVGAFEGTISICLLCTGRTVCVNLPRVNQKAVDGAGEEKSVTESGPKDETRANRSLW
jgi:hypothetical protein